MRESHVSRRTLLRRGMALAAVLGGTVGPARLALANAVRGDGPFGPLGAPDAFGVRVPAGFQTRLVARTGEFVGASSYRWHDQPDGGGTFALAGGRHVYVSNSEIGGGGGGVGAIEFGRSGQIVDARSILRGTSRNCSGGVTPWGTWLSCEEAGSNGQVWECDPSGTTPDGIARPALGAFNHEAVEVVQRHRALFLTEDSPDGRLYRFRPTNWPDLSSGTLEAARVGTDGEVTWVAVSDREPARGDATTPFDGPEGLAAYGDSLFMSSKGDRRLWRYDMSDDRIGVLHDAVAAPDTALSSVDNLFVDQRTGNLFVAEDQNDRQQLCVVSFDSRRRATIAPVVELTGHTGSEVTGPSLSPGGRTMYVSSQRGADGYGLTFAIAGPWRGTFDHGVDSTSLRAATRLRQAR